MPKIELDVADQIVVDFTILREGKTSKNSVEVSDKFLKECEEVTNKFWKLQSKLRQLGLQIESTK